ncbi:MAG: pilus assembly protein [Chloroflexi bacterium]|nr:pilus assembly protein [Chloroflexota bacterium]
MTAPWKQALLDSWAWIAGLDPARTIPLPRSWKQALHRLRQDVRGAQLVEFAIVVPILLLLVMGLIDFGRAYFSWIIITNGAREGARVAAVGGTADAIYDRVINAVSGLPTAGSPTLESCPPSGNRGWCIQTDNVRGDPGDETTVRVQYNFQFLVPGLANLTPGIIQLTAESTMRLEG